MNTTNSPQNGGQSSGGLKKSTVEALVKNYQQKVKKVRKSTGKVEDYDPKRDSKSIWFSKKVIDQLFKSNGCTDEDGMRIYFGVHDTSIMPTPYDDQLMVVLVATKVVNGVVTDQLSDGTAVASATTVKAEDSGTSSGSGTGTDPGTGVDHGSICPPNC